MPSFAHALPCIDIMSFRSEPKRCLGCFPSGLTERHPSRRLTVEQLLYSSDCMWTGRGAQMDAKTNLRFGNIVPKQWIFSGFLQHTSANSMYKNDNKTNQQLKVLHMSKMLQRVIHFSNDVLRRNPTTVLMAKSPQKRTLCTPLSIDQCYIFGIFEHKWVTRKHTDLTKFSWCIIVQKKVKPTISKGSIAPEPWNRQVVIFEDT